MSIHLIFTVAAVFGSYLVIRAFHKFHSLRTASNVILVSLSTADGLLAIPLIFGIVQMSLRLLNGSDAECSSGPLGKITFISSFFLISVIILHLALISVERLIAVKFALRYHTIVTNPRALIVALAMWFFAATVTITFATTLVANSGDIGRFRQAMDPHCKNPEDPLDHDLNPLMKGLLIFLVNVFASHPLGNHFVFIWLHLYRLLQTKEKYKRTKQHSRNGYRHQARNERRQYSCYCCSCPPSQYRPTDNHDRPSLFRRNSRTLRPKEKVN
ncbi:unnamed protein product [Porites lobata]|uniref:G-protein coupled receptors family 1 profile domain-containing protein n=1 Tax=Porites lobata TaxID=104759 RepID=A0ABN8S3V0_9CNID|nr:unnamed protein product [Porites lobata]